MRAAPGDAVRGRLGFECGARRRLGQRGRDHRAHVAGRGQDVEDLAQRVGARPAPAAPLGDRGLRVAEGAAQVRTGVARLGQGPAAKRRGQGKPVGAVPVAAGGDRLLAEGDGLGELAAAQGGLGEEVQQERLGADDVLRRVAQRRRDVDRAGIAVGEIHGSQADVGEHGLALVAGAAEKVPRGVPVAGDQLDSREGARLG